MSSSSSARREEDDDPVVREIPVHLSDQLRHNLYVGTLTCALSDSALDGTICCSLHVSLRGAFD